MSEWVVLELSSKAEGEDPTVIQRSVRNIIRDAEVFVPASVTQIGDDRVIQYLVDGYAFIRRDHPDEKYIRLEGSRYVQSVITQIATVKNRAVRQVSCVSEADIDRMKCQVQVESDQGIGVGDTVRIISGAYKQITAIVIEDIPEMDKVQVQVKLRSKESLVTLPRSFLRLVSKAPRPPWMDKVDAFRRWLRMARFVALWSDLALGRIVGRHGGLVRFNRWLGRGAPLERFLRAYLRPAQDLAPLRVKSTVLDRLQAWANRKAVLRALDVPLVLDPIVQRGSQLAQFFSWSNRGKYLTSLVRPAYISLPLPTLESRFADWAWLRDVVDRLGVIENEVAAIGQALDGEGGTLVQLKDLVQGTLMQNVILDGYNLVYRCMYAPGMDSLADSKGRPTGMILGFLRSLAAIKKRWPEATFYVCWDGSSQRRKKLFAGYKANRQEHVANGGFNPVAWLKETLPFLGVYQAYHADEEADDVMASLVRGRLKGQRNVILTTDRDMLQLVTETDFVLVPSVGGRKEILFDRDAVIQSYGVTPEQMPSLRAFLGDTSDNIPGVARVPAKVITNLVKIHGTVSGVYSSTFVGLTKFQYEKLQAAEDQVRLNVRLMTLDTELPFVLLGPDVDRNVAIARLQDVEVKADPILAVFVPAGPMRRVSDDDEQRVCHPG